MRRNTRTRLEALALLFGVLLAAAALCAPPAHAKTNLSPPQDGKELKEQEALYRKFLDNFRGGPVEQKIAYEAAEKYVEKYGKQKEQFNVDVVDYLGKWMTKYEAAAAEYERRKESGVGVGLGQIPGGVWTGGMARRIALVIGNGAYEAGPSKNSINDARDVARTLRELSFEVVHAENLSREDLKRHVREFGDRLRQTSIGLFYYAGHGVQLKGTNYLVPVDARARGGGEAADEFVDAGSVLAEMKGAGNAVNILVLDACRDNPFARGPGPRGLAKMDALERTLIAYACAPDSAAGEGEDGGGVYARELLKVMRTRGLGVGEVFEQAGASVRDATEGRQTPWVSASLVGKFYLAGAGPAR